MQEQTIKNTIRDLYRHCVHFIFTRTGCTDFLNNYRRVAEAINGFQINDLSRICRTCQMLGCVEMTGFYCQGTYIYMIGTGVCASVEDSCLTESLAFSLNPARGS